MTEDKLKTIKIGIWIFLNELFIGSELLDSLESGSVQRSNFDDKIQM